MLATLVATSGLALGARRCAAPRMVNSDSRPTQEYMDFLMGKGPEQETEDCGSIIVGDGRVELALGVSAWGGGLRAVRRGGVPVPRHRQPAHVPPRRLGVAVQQLQ